MKRYVARHYNGPDTGLDYGLEVWDDDENVSGELASYLTATQAHVMAFALNTVTQGHQLCLRTRDDDPVTIDYEGPTS